MTIHPFRHLTLGEFLELWVGTEEMKEDVDNCIDGMELQMMGIARTQRQGAATQGGGHGCQEG